MNTYLLLIITLTLLFCLWFVMKKRRANRKIKRSKKNLIEYLRNGENFRLIYEELENIPTEKIDFGLELSLYIKEMLKKPAPDYLITSKKDKRCINLGPMAYYFKKIKSAKQERLINVIKEHLENIPLRSLADTYVYNLIRYELNQHPEHQDEKILIEKIINDNHNLSGCLIKKEFEQQVKESFGAAISHAYGKNTKRIIEEERAKFLHNIALREFNAH